MMRTETDKQQQKGSKKGRVFPPKVFYLNGSYGNGFCFNLSPGSGTTLDVSHKGREGRGRQEGHQPKRFKTLKDVERGYDMRDNVDDVDLGHDDVVMGGVVPPATELCQPFVV